MMRSSDEIFKEPIVLEYRLRWWLSLMNNVPSMISILTFIGIFSIGTKYVRSAYPGEGGTFVYCIFLLLMISLTKMIILPRLTWRVEEIEE